MIKLLPLLAIYGAVEIGFHFFGKHFDASPLPRYWQFLDIRLLSGRLAESLWYLHAQPPLFNAYLGTVLQLAPQAYNTVFHITFGFLGFLTFIGLHQLLLSLGVGPRLSLVGATLFLASPGFLFVAHWLYVTLPVTAALVGAAVALSRCCQWSSENSETGSPPRTSQLVSPQRHRIGAPLCLHSFFFCLLAACLLHPLYHLVWFLASIALVTFLFPRSHRRPVLLAAAFPLLLLIALYTKNSVLFGVPGAGSWAGMSLAKNTVRRLTPEERATLVAQHKLSPLSEVFPFTTLDKYPRQFWGSNPHPNVRALTIVGKSESRWMNYNHWAIPAISRQYMRDSLVALRERPSVFLTAVAGHVLLHYRPVTDFAFLDEGASRLPMLQALYDQIVYLRVPGFQVDVNDPEAPPTYIYLTLLIGGPICLGLHLHRGAWYLLRPWAARDRVTVAEEASLAVTPYPARIPVTFFMAMTAAYTLFASISLETVENNRLRFPVEPYYIALLLTLIPHRSARASQ